MEELDKALAKITDAMTELATKHGPDAVDLTLEVARLHAINDIVSAFLGVIIFGFLCKKFYEHCNFDNDHESMFKEVFAPILTGLSGIVALINFGLLLYVPAWYGMFEPKVYLAYKLMGKIIN